MNPQKDSLSEALRELAATSPQASPELGVRLSNEFTRHHVQRRRKRTAVAIGWRRALRSRCTGCVRLDMLERRRWLLPAAQTAQAPTRPQVRRT